MDVNFDAPFSEMDELCIHCGSEDVEYNSNLCSSCQHKLGIKKLGAESFEAESGQMCGVCFGNDDLPYDSDHFTDCRRCGKSVCIDCDGEMEYHPDWFKVCGECDNILENVSIHGAETFEANEYSYYHRKKAERAWRKNYEESGILQDREKWNELYDSFDKYKSQGFSKGQSMVKSMKEMGIYNQLMQGVNVDAFLDHYSAESFDAESKFDKLANNIAAQYRKKGKSAKEAMRIGKATAYKIGARKYGKAGMARKARAGMRAESFEAGGLREVYCKKCGYKHHCWGAEEFEAQHHIDEIDFQLVKDYVGNLNTKEYRDFCYEFDIDFEDLEELDSFLMRNTYNSKVLSQLGIESFEAESFGAEGTKSKFPWLTMGLIGLGAFFATRIKTVDFKADCGCGCKGAKASGCGDGKDKKESQGYPEVYDPVQDYLPKYRYPKGTSWSNAYNPSAPYRPLDYQSVHVDSNTKAKRM